MSEYEPDGKTTYSTLIRTALGNDKPAPYCVPLTNGSLLRNKWIIDKRQATPLLREKNSQYYYVVYNWVNIIDTHKQETYTYSDHDYCSIFTKHSAKSDAIEKAQELNERDRCILALVKGI